METSHGWFRAFRDLEPEYQSVPLTVSGKLPSWLEGSLYRVGVGQYTAFGQRLPHWFDGDGAVLRVELGRGEARATARLVRTEFAEWERSRGQLFLGTYGKAPLGLWRRVLSIFDTSFYRNAANTNVFFWNDRLFALWEGGPPTELDPLTLQTRGATTLGGLVKGGFSAHPHHVAGHGIVNFGVRNFPPRFFLYRLDANGAVSRQRGPSTGGRGFLHDFWATDRLVVLAMPPVFVDAWGMIAKGRAVADSFVWKAEKGSFLWVKPVDGKGRLWRLPEPVLPLHFANAFESRGKLVVDFIAVKDLVPLKELDTMAKGFRGPSEDGYLYRCELDLDTRDVGWRRVSPCVIDLPRLSPGDVGREYRWLYGCGFEPDGEREFYDALVRIDVSDGTVLRRGFGRLRYPSEPIVARNPSGTGEEALLTVVFDAETLTSSLVVLRPDDFLGEPMAVAPLPHPFPLTFHGCWVPRGARAEQPR